MGRFCSGAPVIPGVLRLGPKPQADHQAHEPIPEAGAPGDFDLRLRSGARSHGSDNVNASLINGTRL